MNRFDEARRFAILYHGDQKYGGEFPYAIHLQAVESVLLRFNLDDEELRMMAWLHDVLEDTPATYEEVLARFGGRIADCVSRITLPKGGNRAWRYEQQYPQINASLDAVTIKVADRIANIESGGKLYEMYRKEHVVFRKSLSGPHQSAIEPDAKQRVALAAMWTHLESRFIA